MLKRVLMVAVVATAISVPAIAGAATKTHKKKAHAASLTVAITNLSPPGAIAQGRQTYTGSVDGTLGGAAIHGAVRGVNNYTGLNFTGTITTFGPLGSTVATVTGSGTVNPTTNAISFTGTTKVTGGTGIYKGATGTLTFTGNDTNKDADGDNDAGVASFTANGSIKY